MFRSGYVGSAVVAERVVRLNELSANFSANFLSLVLAVCSMSYLDERV